MDMEQEDLFGHVGEAPECKAEDKGKGKGRGRGRGRARNNSDSGNGRGRGRADGENKKKQQPVTTCICPGCSYPKYPGSRFCSMGDHKRAWDNMVYQRRSRKEVTDEQKRAFDDAMKDDGFAGREVAKFAKDNPPEMRRKGLVDFLRFERIRGEKVSTNEQHGRMPMTEKAFYKHCDNVLGLSEEESKEYWLELYEDRTVERDSKGYRGAERLWIEAHDLKFNAREHFVANQVVESSDQVKAPTEEQRTIFKKHLARQDLSFNDEHFDMNGQQSADTAKGPCPAAADAAAALSTPNSKAKPETNETPEKTVNLCRERPVLHRQIEASLRKIEADINKAMQAAVTAQGKHKEHPSEMKASDRALLTLARILQFRQEVCARVLGKNGDIIQLVPDSAENSVGPVGESLPTGAPSSPTSVQTGQVVDGGTKSSLGEELARKQEQQTSAFLASQRCANQKFWEGEVADLQDLDSVRIILDKVLEVKAADTFLQLKADWQKSEKVFVQIFKSTKVAADDLLKHMKVKVSEAEREKKRKISQDQKNELLKVKKEQKAAADAIKNRKVEVSVPALFTAELHCPAVVELSANFDAKQCDWTKPWAAAGPEVVQLCLGEPKVQKALAAWAVQYKRALAQAKLDLVTFPFRDGDGKEQVDGMFEKLLPQDGLVSDISSVSGGEVFMNSTWLFGASSDLKSLSFLPNHAAMIKVLVCGKVTHLLFKWDTVVSALGKQGVEGQEEIRKHLLNSTWDELKTLTDEGASMQSHSLQKNQVLYIPMGWAQMEVASDSALLYGVRKSFFMQSGADVYKQAIAMAKAAGGKDVKRMEEIHAVLSKA